MYFFTTYIYNFNFNFNCSTLLLFVCFYMLSMNINLIIWMLISLTSKSSYKLLSSIFNFINIITWFIKNYHSYNRYLVIEITYYIIKLTIIIPIRDPYYIIIVFSIFDIKYTYYIIYPSINIYLFNNFMF